MTLPLFARLLWSRERKRAYIDWMTAGAEWRQLTREVAREPFPTDEAMHAWHQALDRRNRAFDRYQVVR